MAAILSAVAAALSVSYAAPRLAEFAWGNAFTWFGKTFATWAAAAILWDIIVNNGEGDEFTAVDLGGSLAATLVVRSVM